MKKTFLMMCACLLLSAGTPVMGAEDFLGAPVISDGTTITKTEKRLEISVPASHEKVLEFYKKALDGVKDIKFRDWKDSTYIEDDSNNAWHSITISKVQEGGATHVVIMKDNWTWIIGTLILRFVGVFVVLLILFLGMNASGAIISRSVAKKTAATKTAA